MKKNLLFASLILLGVSVFGQGSKADLKPMPAKAPNLDLMIQEATTNQPVAQTIANTPAKKDGKETDFVSVTPIGTSGNAFGFFVGSRTANISVNNDLNAIAFTHRLQAPTSSYIGYDVSFDRGATWQLNQVNYNPTLAGFFPARYPLGAIYNPEGNTDPQNAYHVYAAPLLDGSLGVAGSWGGVGYGAKKFAEGSTPVQNSFNSSGSITWWLPSTFTIQPNGTAWLIDERTTWDGTTSTFAGILNVSKGTFNEGAGNFEYEVQEWPFDVNPDDGINDIEIAFSPDGSVGWISLLTNGPTTLPYTSYHPILFKTTDGGETWSDPIEVQLGGAAGLEGVKQFITDEALVAFYDPEPVPSRDEIPYYMGYYHDLVVDAWGNPHLHGNVMLADLEAGSIYTGPDYNAPFHIWSTDGGTTWQSYKLGNILQFEAEFTGGGSTVSHYNHNQVSSTPDGTVLFFSWIDSDIPDAADNTRPDIYFCDFMPYMGANGTHGTVENVTVFSPAMWTANWATMPERVFVQSVGANSVECTIPWIYQKLDAAYDPSVPVQFNYIPDFKKTYTITGVAEKMNEIAAVSQNQPNPFKHETTVQLTLVKSTDVTVEVFSLTGQKMMENKLGMLSSGVHPVKINAGILNTGVYLYTITTGNQKITRKMIVE